MLNVHAEEWGKGTDHEPVGFADNRRLDEGYQQEGHEDLGL